VRADFAPADAWSWIYEAVRSGTLPCLRIGRHIRFMRAMLEEWLQGRVA
jgi:predicted DNA-binding transcriptional regulator AlpA